MWASRLYSLARVGAPNVSSPLLLSPSSLSPLPSRNFTQKWGILGAQPQKSLFFREKKSLFHTSVAVGEMEKGGEGEEEEEKDRRLYFTDEDSQDEGIPVKFEGIDPTDELYDINYLSFDDRPSPSPPPPPPPPPPPQQQQRHGGRTNSSISSSRRSYHSSSFLSFPPSSSPPSLFSSSSSPPLDEVVFSSDSEDEDFEEEKIEREREEALMGQEEEGGREVGEGWEGEEREEVFGANFEGGFGIQDTEIQSVIDDAFGRSFEDQSRRPDSLEDEIGQLERASNSLAVEAISQIKSPDQIFDTAQTPDKIDPSIQATLDNIDKKVLMGQLVVTPSDSPAARHIVERVGEEAEPGKEKNKKRVSDTILDIPSPSGPDYQKRPRLAIIEVETPPWKDFGQLSAKDFFEGDKRTATSSFRKFNEKNCTFLLRSQAAVKNFEGIKDTLSYMKKNGGGLNRIHYSAALAGAAECKKYHFAVELYEEMKSNDITPSCEGFGALIRCCFETKRVEEGLRYFKEVEDSVGANVVIFTTIIAGFVRLGDLGRAWDIYRYMLSEGHQPDQITYCTMISACTRDKAYEKALAIFNDMENEGQHPDQATYHALLNVCAQRHDCYDDMFRLYKSMVAAGFKANEKTLTHMLTGASRAADVRGAELIVSEMNRGRMRVSDHVLELLLRTYGRSIRFDLTEQKKENFDKGKKLYGIIKQKHENRLHYRTDSAYLYLLCETGRINTARDFFDNMMNSPKQGNIPRTQDWNTLIKMYTRNNRIGYALQAYEEMKATNLEPSLMILERMVRQTARAGLIQQSLSFLSEMADKQMIPHKYVLEPLIRKTKGYPDTWKLIKSELQRIGMSPGAIDMYFPPVKPMKTAPKELTKRSVRLRLEKHNAPKQGRKRKEAGLKEVIISRY